jgi:hypothetical protein
MCFSAQASFSAAVLLGAIGIANVWQAPSKIYWLLAAVPFFFGLQQFFEGILWLTLTAGSPNPHLENMASYGYLFFALLFWPIWIPFSIYVIEEIPTRKKFLFIIFLAGCVLASVNFFYGLSSGLDVKLDEYSIRYTGNIPSQKWIYLAIVVLPPFISSFKNLWQFGVAIALTALLALYFYQQTYVSVWCFFSAIVSVILFKIFKDHRRAQSLK